MNRSVIVKKKSSDRIEVEGAKPAHQRIIILLACLILAACSQTPGTAENANGNRGSAPSAPTTAASASSTPSPTRYRKELLQPAGRAARSLNGRSDRILYTRSSG